MLISLIALAVACASLLLILGGLRMVAQDTWETLRDIAVRAYRAGDLVSRTSFAMLWAMIFSLSYF